MGMKNGFTNAQLLAIAGGIVTIISVFLPWFSAKASGLGMTSSISVNGLGSISGSGLLLGFLSGKGNWEFQGIGVLALGIVSIAVTIFLREKLRSIALFISGALIIGGGVVNIRSIGEFSGDFMGASMQSGAGYGLYVVVLAGAMVAAGGLLAWNDVGD
jgi:lipoprotein signal peptidase